MGVKGWEVVFRGERLKADLIAAVLEANGITAEVFGDTADAEAARALELITNAEEMPPDQV